LEADWARFETEVQKYVKSFGEQIKQQQATFKLQADAQLKAWREAADKFQVAAAGFAAERRSEIEANVKRMKADAVAAEEKLQKLDQAGTQSWSVLTAALTETRAVFDRAIGGAGGVEAGRLIKKADGISERPPAACRAGHNCGFTFQVAHFALRADM
jgi:hypothetical protein